MTIAGPIPPNLAMPRWAHVPGISTQADHEILSHAKALVPSRFQGFVPARHPALHYGITLNDREFFWESHEILEAVWAAAPQGGRERILLRACIQVANANLKMKMAKPHAAARLLGEALAELDELTVRKATGSGGGFADSFPTTALADLLRSRLAPSALSANGPVIIGLIAKI
jgi:hypothetical protein